MSYAPIPMVPGPVSVPADVLAALAVDYGSGDLEAAFPGLYAATSRQLGAVMESRNEVVLMTGEGMLGLWAGLKSCLKAGDPVLSVGTGLFGDGIGQLAASLGCRVKTLSLPYDATISEADLGPIEDAIRAHKPVMITAVHCETPSGTLNPLEGLGRLKKDLGVPLFYVDAVASLGGAQVCADEWNIDLCLGGSQKALSVPPSMTFVGVSEAAWERIASVGYQGYDALLPFRGARNKEAGGLPYTPYWHGLAAMHASSAALLREGLGEVYARHEAVARRCRAGLAELGIRLWTRDDAVNSPTVTAARIPDGLTWPDWDRRLRARGLVCGSSYGPMADCVFRIGHMGSQADMALMEQTLAAIAEEL